MLGNMRALGVKRLIATYLKTIVGEASMKICTFALVVLFAATGGALAQKGSCSAGYNVCVQRCSAQRGSLDAGPGGCAVQCQRLMTRCLSTGCYAKTNCGFSRN